MTEPLTVATFAWAGERPIYNGWTASNLRRMVAKHLTIPHRFVCITDQPDDPGFDCETYPLWEGPPIPRRSLNCFVRLKLATAEMREVFGPRVLWLDQDVVIRGNLDSLLEPDVPFRCLRFLGREFLSAGMVLVRPGEVDPDPWAACFDTRIVAASKQYTGSDQAMLSALFLERVKAGEVPTWGEHDGIALNTVQGNWRIMFRTGRHKPWTARAPERELYLAESEGGHPPLDARYAGARQAIADALRAIEQHYPQSLHHRRTIRRLTQALTHLEEAYKLDGVDRGDAPA